MLCGQKVALEATRLETNRGEEAGNKANHVQNKHKEEEEINTILDLDGD